jgi:small subunit ribosomal protein S2
MALPEFTMRQLLEAGVHFGHQTRRWNPKMRPYLFGARNGVHVIDLEQTVPLLHQALIVLRDTAAQGGRILYVGTKRQASKPIAGTARRCGQYYVNHRWLGGMLTNWKAISGSIKTLADLEATLDDESAGLTKKELLRLVRRRNKLELALGGIRDMGGVPDLLVIIDTNKEDIAILEARKLGIPVVAIIDSNCDPELITHPVPGNDDAIRAINLYCDLFARAVIDGLQQELAASGADIGAAEEGLAEDLPPADAAAPAEAPVATDAPVETDAPVDADTPPPDAPKAPEAPEAKKSGDEELAAGA